jgi:hypothetical protein
MKKVGLVVPVWKRDGNAHTKTGKRAMKRNECLRSKDELRLDPCLDKVPVMQCTNVTLVRQASRQEKKFRRVG